MMHGQTKIKLPFQDKNVFTGIHRFNKKTTRKYFSIQYSHISERSSLLLNVLRPCAILLLLIRVCEDEDQYGELVELH